MRVALIGTGRIGTAHAQVVRDHPEVERLVVADADAGRAASLADTLGVEHAPVQEAIASADAVVIAAATTAHPELIVAAARRGLPVFCEKPIAADVVTSVRVVRGGARDGGAHPDRVPAPLRRGLRRGPGGAAQRRRSASCAACTR